VIHRSYICSLIDKMGWSIKYLALGERNNLRQKDVRAAFGELIKKHDVQILYSRNQDSSKWSHSINGTNLLCSLRYEEDALIEAKLSPS